MRLAGNHHHLRRVPPAGMPNGSRSPLTTRSTVHAAPRSSPTLRLLGAAGRMQRKRQRDHCRRARLGSRSGMPPARRCCGRPAPAADPGTERASAAMISSQAASCGPGAPGARAPLTRYGCSTRATTPPEGNRGVAHREQVPGVRAAARAMRHCEQERGRLRRSTATRAGPPPVLISIRAGTGAPRPG